MSRDRSKGKSRSKRRRRSRSPAKSDAYPLIRRGDHIYRPIWAEHGATHHGIYMGNNEVIHFTGAVGGIKNVIFQFGKDSEASIKQTSLAQFMGDYPLEKIKVFDYTGYNIASVQTTLDRARSLIGETYYSLPFRNCEHFANWCKTGKWYSDQIKKAYDVVKMGGRWIGVYIPSWSPLNKAYRNIKHVAGNMGVYVPTWDGKMASYL